MKWITAIIITTSIFLFSGIILLNVNQIEKISNGDEKEMKQQTMEKALIQEIEEARDGDSLLTISGIEKEFIYDEKTIKITDLANNEVINYKLLSDYKQYVNVGKDVWIAEIEIDFLNTGKTEVFDEIDFYNIKENYSKITKEYKLKYKTEWNDTICEEIEKEKICNTELRANWTEFKDINELPTKKAIIGIFTNVNEGEKGEWIITSNGIKIYEFAEFDAVTYWDTNINLGVTGDINYFDGFLWLIDAVSDDIYTFYTNGTRFGKSSVVLSGKSWEGVAVIGNYAYLLDGQSGTDEVYIWNYPAFTDTYTHWDTIDADDARSMIAYDNLLWILDAGNDEVYKFYPNGTYTGIHFDCGKAGAGTPQGITTNGTFIWILDSADDEVYKFYMNGTYTNLKFDISKQSANGIGITNNGTHFFIVDGNDNAYVYDMGIGSEEEPTSCASYQNGQWYIPNGCQCYCDSSTGETMNLNECICEETI